MQLQAWGAAAASAFPRRCPLRSTLCVCVGWLTEQGCLPPAGDAARAARVTVLERTLSNRHKLSLTAVIVAALKPMKVSNKSHCPMR